MSTRTDDAKRPNHPLSRIEYQVMWNRLISVVEEQAQTLVRTAFGTATREAGDLSAGVYDTQGRMLAQTETPFAFNLFNPLTEFMVELPWDVVFSEKGMYTLWVELSGSDVLKQSFYVGQTTDSPPAE